MRGSSANRLPSRRRSHRQVTEATTAVSVRRVSNALTGVAGVHHVAAELSRRGLIALPTVRNTAGYDLIVARADGRDHANIQVKTSLNRVQFFPMPESRNVRAGRKDYYVLVRWLKREGRFEGFMLTGEQARREVRRGERFQRRNVRRGRRRKIVPSIYVGPKVESRCRGWRERWERWTL